MRKYKNIIVDGEYLEKHPDHVFVFGDNCLRSGYGGGAKVRDYPNTYGFITKKYPARNNEAYYIPEEYRPVFKMELEKLKATIRENKDKTFLISQIGSGLANKYKIWETIIHLGLEALTEFDNVIFLYP